jgi:hypothetical protein
MVKFSLIGGISDLILPRQPARSQVARLHFSTMYYELISEDIAVKTSSPDGKHVIQLFSRHS